MIELINFYKFFPIEKPQQLGEELYLQARCLGLRGTLIVAAEGCNLALCGSPYGIDRFLQYLAEMIGATLAVAKAGEKSDPATVTASPAKIINRAHLRRSKSSESPYRRLSLKLRPEIITNRFINLPSDMLFNMPPDTPSDMPSDILFNMPSNRGTPFGRTNCDLTRISPQQFHQRASDPDTLLVDMRNYYEWAIGSFRSALHLPMGRFSELPLMLPLLWPHRERELLTFCTGGIRCERAVSFLQDCRFPRVRQLDGGILHYLEIFPDGLWEGECFVFDKRVSVNRQLEQGSCQLCKCCGQAMQKGSCTVCLGVTPKEYLSR